MMVMHNGCLVTMAIEEQLTTAAAAASTTISSPKQVDFVGIFRLESSENFDQFLKVLGVGYFKRWMATNAKPDYIITKDKNDYYTLRTLTSISDSSITFKNSTEFTENRLDGKKVRAKIIILGNRWIHTQNGVPFVTVIRDFTSNSVLVTSEAAGIVSVRKYLRIK
ncbi:hypothetical protein RDWZM_007879 [Blomia tropicalis]|uniref:Cytosolic fatty-acid binding proteins domain-containing protein n=1 Tax=Blomia tropicalis TaxID=40697 RepID=A0A9Q0M3B9_BLOTA|nr:hypothetical protein RDWZM_007879 [Blomia tropicalis]